jgi:hypothetical protein
LVLNDLVLPHTPQSQIAFGLDGCGKARQQQPNRRTADPKGRETEVFKRVDPRAAARRFLGLIVLGDHNRIEREVRLAARTMKHMGFTRSNTSFALSL